MSSEVLGREVLCRGRSYVGRSYVIASNIMSVLVWLVSSSDVLPHGAVTF